MAMNPRLLVPRAGRSLLLDRYPGAGVAFSLRRLRFGYTGPVVKVRRSSDSAEADFTAAQVSGGDLTSWVGAGNDGFVTTWYDQSLNASHATQGTAGAQPTLVAGGSLVVDGNGEPQIDFDGNDALVGGVVNGVFIMMVLTFDSNATATNALSTRVASSSGFSFDNQSDAHFSRAFGASGSANVTATGGTLAQVLIAFRAIDANYQVWRNGAAGGTSGTGASSSNIGYVSQSTQALSIGKRTGNSGGQDFDGKFSEIIIYPTDQTSAKTKIEADIMGHYGL
jgi:hypothetical protein